MHFSKIYIQDNFVPNIVEDQFRRKVIGIELTLNEGDDLELAKMEAENYIKKYIKDNTVVSHNHIEERVIPESELPEIQVQKGRVIETDYAVVIEEINKCKTINELDEWNIIAKGNHAAGMAFSSKAAQLLSPRGKTLEEQIRSCTELKVLKVYESMVKKDPILQDAYNQTMSNLQIK